METLNLNTVSLEMKGPIAWLTLNRPEKRNAFNDIMIQELISLFSQIDRMNHIRCLLIKANGQHFCAGADLHWMQSMAQYDHSKNLEDAKQLAFLMEMLYRLSKPVITLVQGSAFGGALGLIACSDIVLAAEEATFCLSEVRLGLAPAVISPYVSHKIGTAHAKRYCLTAELFNSHQAKAMGLINEVVLHKKAVLNEKAVQDEKVVQCEKAAQQDELIHQGQIIAHNIAKLAPQATTETKALLNFISSRVPYEKAVTDYTTDLIARLRVSFEGQEGMAAFFEKRTPSWQTQITEDTPYE